MKRLSEADMALLKSRGKVKNGFTTVRDNFNAPKPASKKVKKTKTKHPLVGRVLHTSWGYDMTINNFCKIIEVSPTGKTVKCRMVAKSTNGLEHGVGGAGKAKAGSDLMGPEFRLRVKKYDEGIYKDKMWTSFNGSYPFIINGNTKEDCSYRKGYFSLVSDDAEFYENRVD